MSDYRRLVDWRVDVTTSVVTTLDRQLAAILEREFEEEWEIDDANEEIDHALGLGFVALQSYVRHVREMICRSHDKRLQPDPKMAELVSNYGTMIPGRKIREMAAVWHLGNFWKHRDEWDGDWAKEASKNRGSGITIRGLEDLGIFSGTESPCIVGIRCITDDQCLQPLLDRAIEWRAECLAAYPEPPH